MCIVGYRVMFEGWNNDENVQSEEPGSHAEDVRR